MRYLGFEPTEEKPYYFISYNSEDEDAVVPIVAELNNLSIPMWYDYAIPYDENWSAIIAERVDKCEAVILFYSNKILEKNKSYVIKEYHYARRYTKRVYVVLLEDIAEKIPYDKVDWIDELEKYQLINGSSKDAEYICKELLRYINPRNKPIVDEVQEIWETAENQINSEKQEVKEQQTINSKKKDEVTLQIPSKAVPNKSRERKIIVSAAIFLLVIVGIMAAIINDNHKTVLTPAVSEGNIETSETTIGINDDKDNPSQESNISNNERTDIVGTTPYDVGDLVTFGTYEQDNNASNGKEDIEWRILAKEDNRILVISDKALDCKPYNTSFANVTWETCTLREWLNGTFLNDAFTEEEQGLIQSTNVSADKNPEYGTDPGNATIDKIFLLSITEAEKYFSSDEDRKCVPTEYAVAQCSWISDSYKKDGKATCWWWLRSPGYRYTYATYVINYGSILNLGIKVTNEYDCVRPAMWISLEP